MSVLLVTASGFVSRVIAELSDDELISRITRSEPLPDAVTTILPDSRTPPGTEPSSLRAAADAIGDRQLVRAIGLVFQRAALWRRL